MESKLKTNKLASIGRLIREIVFVVWFALLDIKRHKLRTFLTFLGFIVPTFMIVLIVTALVSVRRMFVAEFSKIFGPDELLVVNVSSLGEAVMNDRLLNKFKEVEGVAEVVPRIRFSANVLVYDNAKDKELYSNPNDWFMVVAEPFDSYAFKRRDITFKGGVDYESLGATDALLNIEMLNSRLSAAQKLDKGQLEGYELLVRIKRMMSELQGPFMGISMRDRDNNDGTNQETEQALDTPVGNRKGADVEQDRGQGHASPPDSASTTYASSMPDISPKEFNVAGYLQTSFINSDAPFLVIDINEGKRILIEATRNRLCSKSLDMERGGRIGTAPDANTLSKTMVDCTMDDDRFFNEYIGYQVVRVRVKDTKQIDKVAAELSKIITRYTTGAEPQEGPNTNGGDFGQNASVTSIAVVQPGEGLDFFNRFLAILSVVIVVLGLIVSVGSLLGLVNTILVAVLEKERDIGVMRAFGAKLWQIIGIFLFEGALITFLAGLVAGVGVWGIVKISADFIIPNIEQVPNVIVKYLNVDISFVVIVSIVTALVGMIASLYPALRATRVDVIKVLRGE